MSDHASLWDLVPADPHPAGDPVDTPELLLGVRSFVAGAAFGSHTHETFDEMFVGLTGHITVWLDGASHLLGPGDTLICPRGLLHHVVNDSSSTATFAVVKSPNTPGDTHFVGDAA